MAGKNADSPDINASLSYHLPVRPAEMPAKLFQIDPFCNDRDLCQVLQPQDNWDSLAGLSVWNFTVKTTNYLTREKFLG